jgi:general secretion pathway protein D
MRRHQGSSVGERIVTSRKQLICLVVGSLLLGTGHSAVAQQGQAIPKTPPARVPTAPVPLRPAKPGSEPEQKAEEAEVENELPQFETGVEFEPMSPRARVTFNLEEAELPDLVRLISNMTGRRFILPSKLRSIKATVFAPTKGTVAEAYEAFLSVLEVNGFTIVPAGRYLKIIDAQNVEQQTIPIYEDGSSVPASDRYITRIHHLENVSAEDVTSLLGRFKSSSGNITSYGPTNMLIITDRGSQIRRMSFGQSRSG